MTDNASLPRTIFVPGRVNLIGEHTDYNYGLSLPFAIDVGVTATVTARDAPGVTIISEDFGEWRSGDAPATWSRGFAAVAETLGVTQAHVALRSTVPAGAGLSSSAAALGAVALALGARGTLRDLAELVRDCEATPTHRVGLLDPLATLGARARHVLLINFSTSQCADVAVPSSLGFTVVHSGESRTLATSGYTQRRQECDAASTFFDGWSTATSDDWRRVPDGTLRRRARHVLSENQRVLAMTEALRTGDVNVVGLLVNESHRSLRDDFDVATPGVNQLADFLSSQPGVYGARLIGGGFGGCVLAVHDPQRAPSTDGRPAWRVQPSSGALELLGRPR